MSFCYCKNTKYSWTIPLTQALQIFFIRNVLTHSHIVLFQAIIKSVKTQPSGIKVSDDLGTHCSVDTDKRVGCTHHQECSTLRSHCLL